MTSYHDKLPKKRMAAGALFFDANGNILLVCPTYKNHWEVPGGVVELNESPRDACRREIKEELSLDVSIGRLLCVDYGASTEEKSESLQFIFDGGALTQEQINSIVLEEREISEMKFMSPQDAFKSLTSSLTKRVEKALEYRRDGGDSYLQH